MGQQIVDWSVLSIEDVVLICEQEAIKVSRAFAGVIEFDDLRQEALMWAATHPAEVKGYIANDKKGFLAKRVWSRLMDIARPEARRSATVSLDAMDVER